MNPGRTSCRRLKRDETRRTGRRRGRLGRDPLPRSTTKISTLQIACCWCWPSLSLQPRDWKLRRFSARLAVPAGKNLVPLQHQQADLANRGNPILAFLRVSDRFIIFGRSAPGPGRPCVQYRACFPPVIGPWLSFLRSTIALPASIDSISPDRGAALLWMRKAGNQAGCGEP
ncbi:hypothetical protein NA56DRAFT_701426 [Hyaloscypha hepaticicola]|uniref:Uncharacterized protein n=1 Tax=Hyaloscypha hepaticicola TaxID=2082293 RepID=A0A2J6QA50_9HELO|nr:hypothetical protein NA56DRAFT_701426 [Hyaloscypha hepaticicola]